MTPPRHKRRSPATATRGPITYFAERSVVLVAVTPFARVKLCRLEFGKDGSIYAMFPYLDRKTGIVSVVANQPNAKGPVTYSLKEGGVEVPFDVKFSHHASGIAQFSKSGTNTTLPRTNAFPLASGEGVVFRLFVFNLRGFKWFDHPNDRDLNIALDFTRAHPEGVGIIAEWVCIDSIVNRSVERHGPSANAVDPKTGAALPMMYIGQHKQSPMQDHVLVVRSESAPLAQGADVPLMVFSGGYERPSSDGAGNHLSFLYPVTRKPVHNAE